MWNNAFSTVIVSPGCPFSRTTRHGWSFSAAGASTSGIVAVLAFATHAAGRGLGADDRSPGEAGDLHPLAAVGLARILLVEELDIDADDLIVIALDLAELVADQHPIVVGHLDVA